MGLIDIIKKNLAAALADGDTGGVVERVASYIYGYNGTTYDLIRTGIADFASSQLVSSVGTLRNLPLAQYLATRPVMSDAQFATFMANTRGDLAVQEQFLPDYEDNDNDIAWVNRRAISTSTGAWTNYASGGAALVGTAGITIKASAGRLRGIGGCNTSAATKYYLLVINKATAPVADDVAVASVPLDTTGSFGGSGNSLDFGEGIYLSAGVSYAISTLPQKVALAGALDCAVWGFYS